MHVYIADVTTNLWLDPMCSDVVATIWMGSVTKLWKIESCFSIFAPVVTSISWTLGSISLLNTRLHSENPLANMSPLGPIAFCANRFCVGSQPLEERNPGCHFQFTDSDHYIVTADCRLKLMSRPKADRTPRYRPPTPREKLSFNSFIAESLRALSEPEVAGILQTIQSAAKNCFTEFPNRQRNAHISDRTWQKILRRNAAHAGENWVLVAQLSREIKRDVRQEKRNSLLVTLQQCQTEREKWEGPKILRSKKDWQQSRPQPASWSNRRFSSSHPMDTSKCSSLSAQGQNPQQRLGNQRRPPHSFRSLWSNSKDEKGKGSRSRSNQHWLD